MSNEHDLDINLTPECVYTYRNPKEPCWGPVEDHGTEARILTCVGHSQVPQGYGYYTQEEVERARVTGGKMTLALHESKLGAVPEELDGIWSTRLPERPYDEGFAAAFGNLVHDPPPPRKPTPVRPPDPLPAPSPVKEKVRLVVDSTSNEDIPEVWKDYL
jgi:hypothetical protein